jgi:hypothetical protein
MPIIINVVTICRNRVMPMSKPIKVIAIPAHQWCAPRRAFVVLPS